MFDKDLLSWDDKYYECLIILIKEDFTEPEKLLRLFELIKKLKENHYK